MVLERRMKPSRQKSYADQPPIWKRQRREETTLFLSPHSPNSMGAVNDYTQSSQLHYIGINK